MIARTTLAAIFAVAGMAKLASFGRTRSTIEAFGFRGPWAAVLARMLPVSELAIAAGLLVGTTAVTAACAAAGLLLLMSIAVVVVIRRGERPACHCFGALSTRPVGPGTLVRNGALVALAILAAEGGDRSAVDDVEPVALAVTVFVALLALLAVVIVRTLLRLLRDADEMRHRIEVLEATRDAVAMPIVNGAGRDALVTGRAAPGFELDGLDGSRMDLPRLVGKGQTLLLLFTDASCGACTRILPLVAGWQKSGPLNVVVIGSGDPERVEAHATLYGLDQVLLDPDGVVAGRYGCRGFPAAVLVTPSGNIGSPLVAGEDLINALVQSTLAAESRLHLG